MFKSLRARIIVILAVIGFSGWHLYSNYSERGSILKLGLDLQGGMHIVMEIDDPEGLMSPQARADGIAQSERVVRSRIDQFGVEEPLIQTVGGERLIVELAGVTDQDRAKELVGQTALLEWKLVRPTSDIYTTLPRIDQMIVAALGVDSLAALGRAVEASSSTPGDSSVADLLFGGGDTLAADGAGANEPGGTPEGDGATQADAVNLAPFSSLVMAGAQEGELLVRIEDYPMARAFLELTEVQAVIPRTLSLQWGWEPEASGGAVYRILYVLERDAALTGAMLEDAQAQRDPQTNEAVVTFELSRLGGRNFSDITGRNIGNRIAIILDGEVVSAPNVISRIGARGQITLGTASLEEARDLALVLRAGALPAPLRIIEERTVGPSLGQDSVDQGKIAGIVGILLVAILMIAYYRFVGILAVAALGVYVILVLGGLAAFGATLTVPGIAGLILSVGMAVDANVLIFERIREELDAGRAVRTAVDEGFGHAISAIVDSNITSLFTSLILFQFGTGPVRGFAVTLSIGILASFFTALFVTRTFLLLYLSQKKSAETLSI